MKNLTFTLSTLLILLCFALNITACDFSSWEGDLVPLTVTDDPSLKQLSIEVAGHSRKIHYETFGISTNPVLFIMHGSLSDLRAYLPFQSFQDKYFVVLWDMRGNGLSERVPEDELDYDYMADELHALKEHFSATRKASFLGHSWSAVFVARYLAKYPDEQEQAILMEPPPLTWDISTHLPPIINLSREGYLDMFWSSQTISPEDNARLDFRMLGMLNSAVRNFFLDPDHLPPWPVWRIGGLALLHWEGGVMGPYDFTSGLKDNSCPVLLVGSSASPIGADFQTEWHKDLFANAQVARIENSGHRMITEQWDALESALQGFLEEYQSNILSLEASND